MEPAEKSEFKFEWRIENFSHCSKKFREYIDSPVFVRHIGDTTDSYIRLFPKGCKHENVISLFLYRKNVDSKKVNAEMKFSICSIDGSSINEIIDEASVSDRNTGWGFSDFALLNRILREKELFLPNDTLTIICSIWEENGRKMRKACARTRIRLQETKFGGSVGNFSSLKSGDKKVISCAIPPSIDFPLYSLSMFFNHLSDESTFIFLKAPEPEMVKISSCETFLVDSSNKLVKCGEYQNVDKIINLSLSKEDLLSRKNDYLPNDILSLYFDVVYSDGVIEFNQMEKYSGSMHSIKLQTDIEEFEKKITEVNDIYYGLKEELYLLLKKGVMCDKILTTPTKSFPVHSVVLSARSPIFHAMFSSDMKEKREESVPICDVDDDVLESLLEFIYKDTVSDLQLDLAFKLFEAADRYEIFLLKKQCALCLKKYLNLDNICQILDLGDLHSDQELVSAAENFIKLHKNEITQSPSWEELILKKPSLVINTLSKLYLQ